MTDAKPAISANVLILIAAAALLAAAIGYTVWRDRSATGAGSESAESAPADSPLAALEAKTRAEPGNVSAWQALAAARFDLTDFAGAAAALEKATSLSPDTAGLWSALGEARVMADKRDPMPPGALAAFQQASALNPKDPLARYFLAVKKDLDGDHKDAIDDWFALLADTPQGAPWEDGLRRTIEQVGKIHALPVADRLASIRPRSLTAEELPVAARAIPGPTRSDMEAASQLPKGQQDAMIEGMVSGLEAKLKASPANVDGWIMLMRSRMTLGETAKAAKALKDAVAANPGAAGRLKAQASLLGVPGA